MITALLATLGGLGIFLIGMAVMTEGLKSLAGNALRRALTRFTSSPVTGATTGAIGTAVLQSSSATTVMAVGFAGAGLLTFSQALGIIFGANIGTTITGWIVATLGFKLQLTYLVMPLVFVGAIMRLLGNRRVAAVGYALAGFGLLFTGISMLQLAMEGMSDIVTPESFPRDTFYGRLLLVLIGIAITLVTQSSSAGVAAAITAVHVGTITLPQAAAMVIGMNVGTTFTAALATLGGTVNARRTGLAHVVYNIMTGMGAFLLLPLYISAWNAAAPHAVQSDHEIALVAFHTLFNGLGVVLVLPFTNRFAKFIVWLVPAHEQELTRRLDSSLLNHPNIAIDSVDATLREIAGHLFGSLAVLMTHRDRRRSVFDRLNDLEEAVAETRVYLGQIRTLENNGDVNARYVSSVHVVDHLARLIRRCRVPQRLQCVLQDRELSAIGQRLAEALAATDDQQDAMTTWNNRLQELFREIDQRIETYRVETIDRAATGNATTDETLASLDAIRWLRRVCYHTWRIAYHLDPTVVSVPVTRETGLMPEGEPEDIG